MHTEQNTPTKIDADSSAAPTGIAGWLIIPSIGLVLAPIKSLCMLIMGINMVQGFDQSFSAMHDSGCLA